MNLGDNKCSSAPSISNDDENTKQKRSSCTHSCWQALKESISDSAGYWWCANLRICLASDDRLLRIYAHNKLCISPFSLKKNVCFSAYTEIWKRNKIRHLLIAQHHAKGNCFDSHELFLAKLLFGHDAMIDSHRSNNIYFKMLTVNCAVLLAICRIENQQTFANDRLVMSWWMTFGCSTHRCCCSIELSLLPGH